MSQVLVCFDPETQTVDFGVDARGFISLEGGLETASLYSTLTNRRAPASNKEVTDQPYGVWFDDFPEVDGDLWGSLLWLKLGRGKLSVADLREVQVSVQDAHKWMLDDGLADTIVVTVERLDPDGIKVTVNITDPDGEQWDAIWEVHRNAVRGTI